MVQFVAHGSTSVHNDGPISVTETVGPYNLELILEWQKLVLPSAMELSQLGAWGAIAIIQNSMLCPPEALEALEQTAIYCSENLNYKITAIVSDLDVEGRAVMYFVYKKLFEKYGPFELFEDYPSAQKWMMDYLSQNHL